jgi:hypothetical protein
MSAIVFNASRIVRLLPGDKLAKYTAAGCPSNGRVPVVARSPGLVIVSSSSGIILLTVSRSRTLINQDAAKKVKAIINSYGLPSIFAQLFENPKANIYVLVSEVGQIKRIRFIIWQASRNLNSARGNESFYITGYAVHCLRFRANYRDA